ncbi:MAG: alpha/beta hydrolase family protein [Candidatus Hermodarchaeota archaeon]
MNTKHQLLTRLKFILKHLKKLLEPKYIVPENKFSTQNIGIIKRLNSFNPVNPFLKKEEFIKKIIEIFGIQVKYPIILNNKVKGIINFNSKLKNNSIMYDESYFISYDNIKIPVFILYPPNFNEKRKYPCILLFSGHGSAAQAAFEKASYQNACGSYLSKNGYIVYIMENRGMGTLSYLGNHLRIDAVARLTGGTWYGEIITDALWLIENLQHESHIDVSRIATAGVSTGGAISMIVSSLDDRISATYIQGFLGSYKTTFGTRGIHCLCGHIPGILKIGDMSDIASLIAPRPVMFVNGTKDSFYADDAKSAFLKIFEAYKNLGSEENCKFLAPEGVAHEFSVDLAIQWFNRQLKL